MTLSENKKIVADFYSEIINEKKTESMGKYLTDDFVHNGKQKGVEDQKKAVEIFLTAFSDLENTIVISIADGDLVAVHEKWTGTHTGDFMGVAATGKKVNWSSTAILEIRAGKISQAWDENDFLGLFQQIGEYPKL